MATQIKPGDIAIFGTLDSSKPELVLIFDSKGNDALEDFRNVRLSCCKQGSIKGESMGNIRILCNIEDLNLHDIILAALKERLKNKHET